MDSALCLPFCPLHFRINKSSTTRVLLSKPHFTFDPSPLSSFPNGLGFRRQQRRTYSNVVFAMDRLSKPATKEKKGGNHEIVIGTVGASLVLACAVAMMGCSGKLSAKACQNSIPTPPGMADSVSTTKGALNSLLDTTVKLASPKVQSIRVNKKFDEVTKPSKDDVDNLKMEAVNLMKAGQGEVAAAKLWKLWKLYEQKNDPEPKHFVKMALVEILIAQGKYEEASKLLEVVPLPKGCEISDARPYLYKVFLETTLPIKCNWNKRVKIVPKFLCYLFIFLFSYKK
ncbi:hypothetical protein FEM48_Zijuj01G0063000 [Ziziphus jujuba var. spinosa]|uniref:Uncharacterized protein n=1 Tax=Ziziphus jujuba var. spinosa TaxID=714518 RepID=A0A978VZL6_ZIZJJ|nr:hypothetical protein FEM48_Zijuj01G0063000 [Ziziphus jujuba var. spinosa]